MRPIAAIPLALSVTCACVIGIPAALGSLFHHKPLAASATTIVQAAAPVQHKTMPDAAHDIPVHVYLSQEHRTVVVPLEQYVKGVVAAEMPADFADEALKAQAVAARTNIVLRLMSGTKTAQGADVTDDFHSDQAYATDTALQAKWGKNYAVNMERYTNAAADTQTEIMTYAGRPIDAKFFSTSNGKTESSAAYFGEDKPYLQSVACPWDAAAKHHQDEITVPLQQVFGAVGATATAAAAQGKAVLQIVSETASHRVNQIRVGDETLSGPEFRSKLNAQNIPLYSTDFVATITGSSVTLLSHGFGHGVGMSQYGADGMAKNGQTYRGILSYFYKGVQIDQENHFVKGMG